MPTSPRKKTRSLESQFQRVSLKEENSGKEPGKVTESQNYQPLAKGKFAHSIASNSGTKHF